MSQEPVANSPSSDFNGGFIWGAGIECSFVPHLNVDQFEWTQHNRCWKDDFRLLKEELNLAHVRYSFPWHAIEPRRGQFDFSAADERVAEANRLGINLVLDAMHFGTPLWLAQAVGDPEFPEALERYTTAIADRYRDTVRMWCPFNEPLISALFSGDFGFWPPHARGWRGYMSVLSRVVQAVSRSIRALRRVDPSFTILLCDVAESYHTNDEALAEEVTRRNLRRFLVLDLVGGRVDHRHPLHPWLSGYGLSELDLRWFSANPQMPDVIGLDYYAHGEWQLDLGPAGMRQRRAESPTGLHGIASDYWRRYGLPMMVTETSVEGHPINREIWLNSIVSDIRRLRAGGIPLTGMFWWPAFDQLDWDGALTHRIGKIHHVGLFHLNRQRDGTLRREASPLVPLFGQLIAQGDDAVGALAGISYPVPDQSDPPLLVPQTAAWDSHNGNGKAANHEVRSAEPIGGRFQESGGHAGSNGDSASSDYGIVVFSHLRWGFVWQRPQQFLSRFAKKHPVLFVEEPFFDRPAGADPDLQLHRVMPNVTVACLHVGPEWANDPMLPRLLCDSTRQAIARVSKASDAFASPLLWYYSPMDSAWSLGHLEARGIVYDCMDELANFSGAPRQLAANEARLIAHADVVFTGGYSMGARRKQLHPNVHVFGCGVDFAHFSKAMAPQISVPPDVDFMARPRLGWFGVIDERLDYGLLADIARARPEWSIAMVGPVVKIDPNLLPHAPNLFWMGGRDYQQLPHYCAAFDVCLMPFALNASTQCINPTKALEYMATGRPIISTHVPDVVKQWSDVVYLAKEARDFIRIVDSWLRQPDSQRLEAGLELARSSSWETTVDRMQRIIDEAIARENRRSVLHAPVPMEDVELAYQYRSTQGS